MIRFLFWLFIAWLLEKPKPAAAANTITGAYEPIVVRWHDWNDVKFSNNTVDEWFKSTI